MTPENLDITKHQVFLYICPGNLPFSFAPHPWFIINKQGIVTRWEVLFRKLQHKTKWGHLYMNLFPPFQGIEIIPFVEKYFWTAKLLGQIEGATAAKIAEFIEKSPSLYPYCEKYFLAGPNSNTYAQWILDNCPEFQVKLPWNSIGSRYKK